MRPRSVLTAAAVVLATAAATAAVLPAPAGASGRSPDLQVVGTVAGGYVGPLQFDRSWRGTYVADAFTSSLWKAGVPAPLAHGGDPEAGGDVGGVAVDRASGAVGYTTTTSGTHAETFFVVLRHGREVQRFDLAAYEAEHNPDQDVHYGPVSASQCARDAISGLSGGAPIDYEGITDSHPYSVASLGNGRWAIADAGGNDVLQIDRHNNVKVLTVLPSVRWTIPTSWVEENGLPACVAGSTWRVEGVPTDVEVDHRGGLVITSLPGFDAPDAGRVYRLPLRGRDAGELALLGTGFDMATNVAVTLSGRIYVVELGSGQISQLVRGEPRPVLQLPGVVAVEADGNRLYASVAPALIGQQGDGRIVRLGPA